MITPVILAGGSGTRLSESFISKSIIKLQSGSHLGKCNVARLRDRRWRAPETGSAKGLMKLSSSNHGVHRVANATHEWFGNHK